jgi:hypothetical protein
MTLHAADNCKGNDFFLSLSLFPAAYRLGYEHASHSLLPFIKDKMTGFTERFFRKNPSESKHFLIFVLSTAVTADHERVSPDTARRATESRRKGRSFKSDDNAAAWNI